MDIYQALKSAIDKLDLIECEQLYPLILEQIIDHEDLESFTELIHLKSGVELSKYKFYGHSILCYVMGEFPEAVTVLQPYFDHLKICENCHISGICDPAIPIETTLAFYEIQFKNKVRRYCRFGFFVSLINYMHEHKIKFSLYFESLIKLYIKYDLIENIVPEIWELSSKPYIIETLMKLQIPITENFINSIHNVNLQNRLRDYYYFDIKEPDLN